MLLDIQNVDISYGEKLTVQDFSLQLGEGKICSLVGESGSGKTTVIRAVLGLLPGAGKVTKGDILFEGRSLLGYSPKEWRELRGSDISMIFQDSGAMMNPTKRIGAVFVEYIRKHKNVSKQEAWAMGVKMLERMHLPDGENVMRSYPFQLSGGMRQRVGIAMAMALQPKLLLADEPTSALDVTIQAQIVRQMMELRREYGTTIIIVTHNMGVASYMSDRIGVMKNGRLVEMAPAENVIYHPGDAYTRSLLDAVIELDDERMA